MSEAEKKRPRLAYTRKHGWEIVEWRRIYDISGARPYGWCARERGRRVHDHEILAWADLPPVPEDAA